MVAGSSEAVEAVVGLVARGGAVLAEVARLAEVTVMYCSPAINLL